MEEAIALCKQVLKETNSGEICIAELKRKGYSRNETIEVLMVVFGFGVVQADELVYDSLAWS